MALANAMNAVGWGSGALTGSWVATLMPATVSLGSWHLTPASNLPFLFCLRGLRLVIALSLLRTFAEPRRIASPPEGHPVWELPFLKLLMTRRPWRSPRVAPQSVRIPCATSPTVCAPLFLFQAVECAIGTSLDLLGGRLGHRLGFSLAHPATSTTAMPTAPIMPRPRNHAHRLLQF